MDEAVGAFIAILPAFAIPIGMLIVVAFRVTPIVASFVALASFLVAIFGCVITVSWFMFRDFNGEKKGDC
ncbi:MAG: hypothetical protein HWN68_08290 [Desulfobacterales bacterium]|nr:hypothetical protein [Desulfobacterales bacterium]